MNGFLFAAATGNASEALDAAVKGGELVKGPGVTR